MGYFEVLSAEPMPARSITYELRWQPGARPPDPALVHGIFCAVDPSARLQWCNEDGARVVGGGVSGVTGIRINKRPVYRNHRLASSMHAVIDQVLVPLHRSHPIARLVVSS